jgi:hypothetical protein
MLEVQPLVLCLRDMLVSKGQRAGPHGPWTSGIMEGYLVVGQKVG